MRIIALLTIAILSGSSSFSQKSKFMPGYYITHQGDTVNGVGFVENRNKVLVLNFKADPDSTTTTSINVLDCKASAFGKDTYVTWYGKRSLSYVNGNDLSAVVHMGEYVKDSICIKLLYQGKGFALYQYSAEKNHFFIGRGATISELVLSYDNFPEGYRLATSNYQKPAYYVNKEYNAQIFGILNDRFTTRKKVDLLEATEYDRHSLIKLFKKLDE